MDNIDLQYIYKAQKVFEQYRKNTITNRDKAGAVKAFDFCYELAWKLQKRVLRSRGLQAGSPKDTFQKAHAEGLIDDPEVWFKFIELRALTIHIYEEENLETIVGALDEFSNELSKLISNVGKLLQQKTAPK